MKAIEIEEGKWAVKGFGYSLHKNGFSTKFYDFTTGRWTLFKQASIYADEKTAKKFVKKTHETNTTTRDNAQG